MWDVNTIDRGTECSRLVRDCPYSMAWNSGSAFAPPGLTQCSAPWMPLTVASCVVDQSSEWIWRVLSKFWNGKFRATWRYDVLLPGFRTFPYLKGKVFTFIQKQSGNERCVQTAGLVWRYFPLYPDPGKLNFPWDADWRGLFRHFKLEIVTWLCSCDRINDIQFLKDWMTYLPSVGTFSFGREVCVECI